MRVLALGLAALCAGWAGLMFGGVGSASAATSTIAPIDVPNNGAPSQIVYDATSQTTYVAWTDPQSTQYGAIDLCVLPSGATTCDSGGPVLLTVSPSQNAQVATNNQIVFSGITVLPANGDVVVVGTVPFDGTVDWESAASGAAFLTAGQGLQNNGSLTSTLSVTRDLVPLSATDVGLLSAPGDDHFSDTAFSGAEAPALSKKNVNPPASGQTQSQYDDGQGNSVGPDIAAEAAPAPAASGTDIVVGVGDNLYGPNSQLTDCTNGDTVGTGFGLDVGKVNGSASSNAAGNLNYTNPSTGVTFPAYSPITCNAKDPTLAEPQGGTQGIGLLEDEGNGLDNAGSTYTLDYRPFTATSTGGSFGSPVVVTSLTGEAEDTEVADDATDGVYVMWYANLELMVDYSANGGTTWGPPVEVPNLPLYWESPMMTPSGGGNFELSFEDNPNGQGNQTYIDYLNYQALQAQPTALTSTQKSGSTSGASISITAGTSGETDTAALTGTNASTATGTVNYSLWTTAACTGTAVSTSQETVTNGAIPASGPVSAALPAGTYYWEASYSGDSENLPSTTTCGAAVLTVTAVSSNGGGGSGGGKGTVTTSTTATATPTGTVTLQAACSVVPCTVKLTLKVTITEIIRHKRHKVAVVVGTATFKINKTGKQSLTVKLNATGRKLLKKDHRLKATAVLKVITLKGTTSASTVLTIVVHQPPKKTKK